jgi:hypothetical protein
VCHVVVFIVIGLLAAVLNVVLIVLADLVGMTIAYGIAGLLCGLVLRTRLVGGVQRTLVVCLFMIGFPAAVIWITEVLVTEAMLVELVALHALPWAVVGLGASIPYLVPRWRDGTPLIAAVCFGAAGGLGIILTYDGTPKFPLALLFVHPMLICLGAGVFDQICGGIGLESPQRDFDRLRVQLEFRRR